MARFVKYYDLSGHWLSKKHEYAYWWMDLVYLANYEESRFFINGFMVKCKRGELAWSVLSLAERWKVDRQRVRTFLKLLEKDFMITSKSNQQTTIITICNYCKYQDNKPTDKPTPNQRLTNGKPTPNHIIEIQEVQEVQEVKHIRANAHVSKHKKPEFNGQDCEDIFGHWKAVMGHPQSQLLDKRKKLIQKTLDSGYTPMQIKLAIDGHKKSKWHKENGFDGIEYSLKPENIDKFIRMAGMTNDELSKSSGKLNWDDTSWADGLQAEYGVRN